MTLRTWRTLVLPLAVAAAPTLANPNGPAVAAGSATFSTSGTTLTVTSTHNTIINWQGFSIGAGETTRFSQPSAGSMVLNRVVTATPSSIQGSLVSNGGVFLVNPNGVVFSPGSQVQVAAFTVSSQDIADANFLAGNYVFTPGPGAAIVIGGTIESSGALTVNGPATAGGGILNAGGALTVTGAPTGSGNLVVTGTTINVGGTVTSGSAILTQGRPVVTPVPGRLVARISPVQGPGSVGGRAVAGMTGGGGSTGTVGLRLEKRDLAF